jgi:hypothetical protein
MLDEIRINLDQNLARVERLVTTYESHPDSQGQGRKSAEVLDILRAAVVLLHASVEDVLRSIARWKLPGASSDALNNVPLVGQGSNPRKFLLGDLAAHRGKTVDQLLADSVNAYLERSNYNNTAEIAALLAAIPVDVANVNAQFSELQEMMERRHQIVHRADRQMQVSGSGDHEIRGINKGTVRGWAASARAFCNSLFAEL